MHEIAILLIVTHRTPTDDGGKTGDGREGGNELWKGTKWNGKRREEVEEERGSEPTNARVLFSR